MIKETPYIFTRPDNQLGLDPLHASLLQFTQATRTTISNSTGVLFHSVPGSVVIRWVCLEFAGGQE